MDHCSSKDDLWVPSTPQNAVLEGVLAVLGQDAATGMASICCEITNMKPCEVVRLLNSTPLGTVVNERQLHRHRGRAGDRFVSQKRINLIGYIAWLFGQRHRLDVTKQARLQGKISSGEVLALVQRQEYRCALTGRSLTPSTASLDHIQSIARNGKHDISNAQVLHKQINRIKGTLTNQEFIAVCREVVAHANQCKAA